jgi:hypothetical protein
MTLNYFFNAPLEELIDLVDSKAKRIVNSYDWSAYPKLIANIKEKLALKDQLMNQ